MRCRLRDNAPHNLRTGHSKHFPFRTYDWPDDERLHQNAAVGYRRICRCNLERRHANLVAVGHGVQRGPRPLRRLLQLTADLARKFDTALGAEAKIARGGVERFRADDIRHLRHHDIAGEFDRFPEREDVILVRVRDLVPHFAVRKPDDVLSLFSIEFLIGLDKVPFQRRRGCHQFERGTGLEHVCDHAVARRSRTRRCRVARIDRWVVRHRQHFAGRRIEHNRKTALRLVSLHTLPQFLFRDRLVFDVDCQLGCVAVDRLDAGVIDRRTAAADGVALHDDIPISSPQQRVELEFNPAQSLVVDVGKPKQLPCHMIVWIKTPRFVLHHQTLKRLGVDPFLVLRTHTPFQIYEAPGFQIYFFEVLALRFVEHLREPLGQFGSAVADDLRIGRKRDKHHICYELPLVPVDDLPAQRGEIHS